MSYEVIKGKEGVVGYTTTPGRETEFVVIMEMGKYIERV